MNDGTENVPAENFRKNIMDIMSKTLAYNADTEFIFVSITLANPYSVFDGCQRDYHAMLVQCVRDCDAVVNMTSVHEALWKRKRVIDMTENNINHPNDFLIRLYAQSILELF